MFHRDVHQVSCRAVLFSALLLLLQAPPAAASAGSFVLGTSADASQGIYVIDIGQTPPVFHGPFLAGTFNNGGVPLLLRDRPLALFRGALVRQVDLTNPTAPTVADLTPPFTPSEMTLLPFTDEILLLGAAGALAIVDAVDLSVHNSYTLPASRNRALLSPDGRSLLSILAIGNSGDLYLADFDRAGGPGTEAQIALEGLGSVNAFFSPDSRSLFVSTFICDNFLQGIRGISQCFGELETFEMTAPGTVLSKSLTDLGLDYAVGNTFDRSGNTMYLMQRGNIEVGAEHRIRPFAITAPGTVVEGTTTLLTSQGTYDAGSLARAPGGKRIFLSTSRRDSPTTSVFELHEFDPSTGNLATYVMPANIRLFGAFQTGADIFADGFETGDLGSWSVIQ